jgi:hypothetical protein
MDIGITPMSQISWPRLSRVEHPSGPAATIVGDSHCHFGATEHPDFMADNGESGRHRLRKSPLPPAYPSNGSPLSGEPLDGGR